MNDNYMKTILSGVKEWTESLTDDAVDKANNAIDKANNALEQANNALDKALFVVNITQNSGGAPSADKTFDEIVQVYNEGKYSIVANLMGLYIFPLFGITNSRAAFEGIVERANATIVIDYNNKIEVRTEQFATTTSKLPNPYPLTFTGAVSGSYDGSSAKTIEIPSGGDEVIIASSTAGSTKKFKITVDDSGTISATEIVAES